MVAAFWELRSFDQEVYQKVKGAMQAGVGTVGGGAWRGVDGPASLLAKFQKLAQ